MGPRSLGRHCDLLRVSEQIPEHLTALLSFLVDFILAVAPRFSSLLPLQIQASYKYTLIDNVFSINYNNFEQFN